MVSPITGEMVPVDQMAEHMRISLIDPRYQEQRAVMMAKIRETTKASDDEISRNLIGLAKARPDVFGALPWPLPLSDNSSLAGNILLLDCASQKQSLPSCPMMRQQTTVTGLVSSTAFGKRCSVYCELARSALSRAHVRLPDV